LVFFPPLVLPIWDFVAQIHSRSHFPFPRTDLFYGVDLRYAKGGVAIEH